MQIKSHQFGLLVLLTCGVAAPIYAEEYMQHCATADDYEQALNRVVKQYRGLMNVKLLNRRMYCRRHVIIQNREWKKRRRG
ncbi:hypothetical protein [Thiospirillum jenense]|uniref:Uncharacterized protein n=1 Tax=Thiospirillum jenense TaxID=1653858 RepID=A0A839HEX4_9GAMM|nr:hypothetical protein [Thiospirillum jenense]MBB1127211.1 hypothetical protein [Thiospirillum jenense]